MPEEARSGPEPAAGRGRPRSPAHDTAILDAALHLLAGEGYARMTIDAVATRAGVSKATVYLRYRSKADLATAALAHLRESAGPERTADLRQYLVALLRMMRLNVERASVMALVGVCLAEEGRTPELLELFRERSVRPRRDDVMRALLEARAGGAVRAEVDLDAVVDLLLGALHSRYLSGEPAPEGWEEDLVDVVLGGLSPAGA